MPSFFEIGPVRNNPEVSAQVSMLAFQDVVVALSSLFVLI
jgi:hypothetical protein